MPDGRARCRPCQWIQPRPGQTNSYPTWLRAVPAILEALELSKLETLDRRAVEELTGLARSASVELMKTCGAQQLGKSLVVSRELLKTRLLELFESPENTWRVDHRRRVAESITEARDIVRARSVSAPRPREAREFDDLPGVKLASRELAISYEGTADLVTKLFAFAQAIAREPERFTDETAGVRRNAASESPARH